MFTAGFPLTTIKSACFPTAIEPIRASSPRNFPPLKLAILIASNGVKTGFGQELNFTQIAKPRAS